MKLDKETSERFGKFKKQATTPGHCDNCTKLIALYEYEKGWWAKCECRDVKAPTKADALAGFTIKEE